MDAATLKPSCPAESKKGPKREEDYIGVIRRSPILSEVTIGDVTLVELAKMDCDGAPIVDAFPATGVVSVLAGMQLVKSMGLPLVGVMKSGSIPAVAAVQCELPSHPVRVFGNRTVVVFVCEFSLEENLGRSIAALVYDFARRHKCPMIYSIEGVATGDTIKLPSGEEIQLSVDDEEGEAEEGIHTIIDDTKLAEAHMKAEEENAKKEATTSVSKDTGKKENHQEGESHDKENAVSEKDKKEAKKEGKKKDKKEVHGEKKKGKKKKNREEGGDKETEKEQVAKELYGDKVHFLTTNAELAKRLRNEMGCIPIVDGLIRGVTGSILAEAALNNQEVTGIIVPTSTIIPSAKSAIVLLRLLEKLIPGIMISVSELEKLEDELEELRKAVMKALPSFSSKSAPPPSLYT